MSRIKATLVLALAGVLLTLSGCAQIMGALRRDLDDGDSYADASPTTGGKFPEHGFLSADLPEGGSVGDRYVGHSERNPASDSSRSAGANSWVGSENAAANRRDAERGQSDDELNAETDPVLDPSVRRQYKNGTRATRADFVDESQNEGSLWASDGQTNYYFTKNKIRGVGDILTINIEQDLMRDVAIETRRTLSPRERDFEMAAAQERLRAKAMGLPSPDGDTKDQVASAAAAPARSPAAAPAAASGGGTPVAPDVDVPSATPADIDVSKSLAIKTGDTMMGEIVERYPNGNYKIRATKRIPYKGGPPRVVTLVGVVKGSDIAEDDTVASGKLYEYRVEAAR